MNFEWDDNKNLSNFQKQGIWFEEAALIFQGPTLSRIDDRRDYGEVRTRTIGKIGRQIAVTVLHTDRAGKIRIISARLSRRMERKQYDDHDSQIIE